MWARGGQDENGQCRSRVSSSEDKRASRHAQVLPRPGHQPAADGDPASSVLSAHCPVVVSWAALAACREPQTRPAPDGALPLPLQLGPSGRPCRNTPTLPPPVTVLAIVPSARHDDNNITYTQALQAEELRPCPEHYFTPVRFYPIPPTVCLPAHKSVCPCHHHT